MSQRASCKKSKKSRSPSQRRKVTSKKMRKPRSPSQVKKSKRRSSSKKKSSSKKFGRAIAIVRFKLLDDEGNSFSPQGKEVQEWYHQLSQKTLPVYNNLLNKVYLLSSNWLNDTDLRLVFATSVGEFSEVDSLLELMTDLDDDGNYPIRGMLVVPRVLSLEYLV